MIYQKDALLLEHVSLRKSHFAITGGGESDEKILALAKKRIMTTSREYLIKVVFHENNEEWFLNNKIEVANNLEWFNTQDLEELASVIDHQGRTVRLIVK
jgi:hypothetical protein